MRAILLKVIDPISYTVTADRLLGSFSYDDGDGNENVKKAVGLLKQNNKFARASRFFVHKKWGENSQAVHALKNSHPSQNKLIFHSDLSYH